MKEDLEQAAISSRVPGIGTGRKVSKLEEELALLAAHQVKPTKKEVVPMDRRISTKDITAAAFLSAHGLTPSLSKQAGKVVFEFPGNERTLKLLEDYKQNPYIKAQDFIAQLKRLQAQKLTLHD